ncbi:MAG TPA: hypothetical protein DDW65_11735 [Firmicutes bacterium]|jgi:NitT/TauT family transport system permease protein|nr:hypothetical protein [Bacillota bacterium]
MRAFITSRNWLGGLAIILVLIGWQLAATLIHMPLILPTPQEALIQIIALVKTADFWHHLGASMGRGILGFTLALFMALLIGTAAGKNDWIEAFSRPLIILMRSTPVMSVIILAMIWFRRDNVPVFVTFLMAFPIVIQNIIEGIRCIDSQLMEMIKTYHVNGWRRLFQFYLPSVVPFLAAGISAGLGITWKVLIAAEVLAYPSWGIGSQMDTARVYLQTDKVFAWTLIVVGLGLIFDYFLDYYLKKPFTSWRKNGNAQS